jgi:trehalose 6-phosphate phosphatase
MKYILSTESKELLKQFASSNLLLAFDFDGTLAPIVAHPDAAKMRPTTKRLLQAACRRYPCIVISGRSRADVTTRLQGTPVLSVVGNHGIELLQSSPALKAQVTQWRQELNDSLGALKGVQIEDKTYSLAIHYRHSREKKVVRRLIEQATSKLTNVRLIGGKQVLNILPPGGPHKGVALLRERSRFHCDTAIFVGDDETDEDVFTLDQPGQLLMIRVGFSQKSNASYYLRTQAEIDQLLRALIQQRRVQRNQSVKS